MDKVWWQKEVVYQIYPKSFCDSNGDGIGDIRGIIQKLDYLHDLGVTMLWICPVYQSPMDDNGYDVSDYQAIAPEFGTVNDVDELIEQAKRRGIKIVLDLVINHSSDEHPWFQRALADPSDPCHDYYIFKTGKDGHPPTNWRSIFGGSVWEPVPGREEYYYHTFGKKQPDLNWENPALRQKLYDMVNWWLDKGIAGFRVDAITFIKKDLTWRDCPADGADGLAKCTKVSRNQPGIGAFLHELKENTFDRHECVTIAEAPGVGYEELGDFIGENGYFSMIFDFRWADLDIASGSEWFKRPEWTIKDLRDKIVTSQMALQKFGWGANFIENHDQPRAASKYLKDAQDNPDAVKTLGAMYFFLRGVPFIYQGQELGMTNFERQSVSEFNDLSSIDQYDRSILEGFTPEQALHFVNLRSRDNARTPFPWNGERYGGFSTEKPWLGMAQEHPACNVAAQQKDQESVLAFYKSLIAFHQNGPYQDCLIYGDIEPLESTDNVIAYQRSWNGTVLDCYFNLGGTAVEELLSAGEITPVWHTQKQADTQGNTLKLAPWQSVIIRVQ